MPGSPPHPLKPKPHTKPAKAGPAWARRPPQARCHGPRPASPEEAAVFLGPRRGWVGTAGRAGRQACGRARVGRRSRSGHHIRKAAGVHFFLARGCDPPPKKMHLKKKGEGEKENRKPPPTQSSILRPFLRRVGELPGRTLQTLRGAPGTRPHQRPHLPARSARWPRARARARRPGRRGRGAGRRARPGRARPQLG